MKKNLLLLFVLICALSNIFSLSCCAKNPEEETLISQSYPIFLPDEMKVLPLSKEYFSLRLQIPQKDLLAVTIISLPKPESGSLMLDGVPVELYDTILAKDLDRLCYTSKKDKGWFSVIPVCRKNPFAQDTKICATFSINKRKEDFPIIKEAVCVTQPETGIRAALEQESNLVYTVVKKPLKGTADCFAGGCTYTPDKGVQGQDLFSLAAMHKDGRVSSPIQIKTVIEK